MDRERVDISKEATETCQMCGKRWGTTEEWLLSHHGTARWCAPWTQHPRGPPPGWRGWLSSLRSHWRPPAHTQARPVPLFPPGSPSPTIPLCQAWVCESAITHRLAWPLPLILKPAELFKLTPRLGKKKPRGGWKTKIGLGGDKVTCRAKR